ncbi:MAG: alkaline phosphatase D family protein [Nannocystis sp.]|nr:alkaline phosphatase D family protein [Nannocystis sp.]
MSRRSFLRATLVTATLASGNLAGGCSNAGDDEDTRPLEDGAAYFPQSVVSGDPRPDSVIVWTRLEDPDLADDADAEVKLELATDAEFAELVELGGETSTVAPAKAMYDRCVKVKVRGLAPATTYYYRFIHSRDDGRFVSPVGRTRTAPAADADAKLRFAVVSCQDFNGRYYNGYARMAAEELDFFIHLGDYIYETTGDPSFQKTGGRVATFTDKAGAIVFNEGTDKEYFAAKSLSNYRELYRTYRSDPALRKIHETVPMIATWDDHEFTDDCHGDVATYYDGRQDETSPDRRKAANQAWFEYMPVDFQEEDFEYDPAAAFPGDIQIYRDFVFGKHMHLVMTDLRSHRTDHLIPEDAFPGAVVLTQAELMAELGELPAAASEYVDIDSYAGGSYKAVLVAAATQLDYDPAKITGNLDVAYINSTLAKLDSADVDPITDLAGLERGLAFRHLGKLSTHASIGARYLVIKEAFDLWATINYKKSGGKTQDAMGPEQQAWFLDTMKGAKETWKLWGNEFCLVPLVIDLTPLPIQPFNQVFYMNVDQWDGMRDRRNELLGELVKLDNVVALTGDIHAFYAGVPGLNDDPKQHITELVTSGMSSGTFRTQLVLQVAADPILSMTAGASDLADSIDTLFTKTGTNRHLAHADSSHNGFMIVELDGQAIVATYLAIAEPDIFVDLESEPAEELAAKFTSVRFKVEAGSRELYKEIAGAWKRWDYDTFSYV